MSYDSFPAEGEQYPYRPFEGGYFSYLEPGFELGNPGGIEPDTATDSYLGGTSLFEKYGVAAAGPYYRSNYYLPVENDMSPMAPGFEPDLEEVARDSLSKLQSLIIQKYAAEGESLWLLSADSKATAYKTAKTLAEYIHSEQIQDVIFIDRSARPMRVGIKEYWGLAFPDEQIPDMHFLSPNIATAPVRPQDIDALTMKANASWEEIGRQLEDSRSTLLDKKDQPILLVDGCIHSGITIEMVRLALSENGFRDIKIAVYSDDRQRGALASSDICVTNKTDSCRPLGMDSGISNGTTSIYTTRLDDPGARKADLVLRAQIREVIREGFAAEQRRNSLTKTQQLLNILFPRLRSYPAEDEA